MATSRPTPAQRDDTRLRTYTITHQIGSGGQGTVCLAEMRYDAVTRRVAIKMMRERDEDSIGRLRDEARALGAVHHPSIVQIITMDTFDGLPGLICEWVDGLDLGQIVKRWGVFPPSVALEIAARTSEGLDAAATQAGLVHRDIKPSNLMVASAGVVRILDFGIAVSDRMTRHAPATKTDNVVGSMHYMDPVRALDAPKAGAQSASDVFSVGCVLFECLAGEKLIPHDQIGFMRLALAPEAYEAHLDSMWREHEARVPPGALSLIKRMVAFDRSQRPTHAEVERECDGLIRAIGGPTLREWARDQSWPALGNRPGDLVGRVYTSDTMVGNFVTTTSNVSPTGPAPRPSAPPAAFPTTRVFSVARAAGVVGAGATVTALLVVGGGLLLVTTIGLAVAYGPALRANSDPAAAKTETPEPASTDAPGASLPGATLDDGPIATVAPITPAPPDQHSPTPSKPTSAPPAVTVDPPPSADGSSAAIGPAVRVEKKPPATVVVPEPASSAEARSSIAFDTGGGPFRGWAIVDDVRTPLPADLAAGSVKIVYSYDGGPDVSLGSFSLAERDTLRIRCNGMLGTCSKR